MLLFGLGIPTSSEGSTTELTFELQNVCGISVVGSDWETLKRYNLNEIYLPTPKPGPAAPVTEGVPAPALSAPDLATKDETHVSDENTVPEPTAAAP